MVEIADSVSQRKARIIFANWTPAARILYCTIVLAALLPAQTAELFRDDFAGFPPGWLSSPVGVLNPAIQAYHYLPHRGVPLGRWANAICHLDAWAIGDEDGKPYLEQMTINYQKSAMNPIFLTGEPEWADYTVQVKVKPLNLSDMVGLVFRYRTNRYYYLFALTGGRRARLALRLPIDKGLREADWRELAGADFTYDPKHYYTLKVENSGPRMRAYIDGVQVLEASAPEILAGKAGVTANVPARFQDFQVTTSLARKRQIEADIQKRIADVAALREQNPKLKLWKKFETPGFGAGLNVRVGDLDGDGNLDMLIGQNIRRFSGNAHQISCLTAVTLDGKVLWQSGRPDKRNGLITTDTPFQIHDIDGDGRNEVVMVKDMKLQILEGSTGAVKHWSWMPVAPSDRVGRPDELEKGEERPYEFENGDSIAFVNFSGNPDRREILVKDRYSHFWVFDNRLKFLWEGKGRVGHYPYVADVDGDGRDEVAIGLSLWDHTGRRIWSREDVVKEHSDGIVMGNFSGDPKQPWRVYSCASDEGFVLLDSNGTVLKHIHIGHAQSPTIGKYRPDLPGLQLMTMTYWKSPGILTLFDYEGRVLAQGEPIHTGTAMLPVNWRGDGQEFILLSANPREGGMMDAQFRRVVMFPDDGHPELASTVANVTGDARDEIIVWDLDRVWIYTQDRAFTGKRIYAPVRNPFYNHSTFRTNVSLPRWVDVSNATK